ncbi:MAG: hypothetical protein OXK79_10050, partial [Chloroflexota bacterium]|nr:hypothetical protein [Chloroflexota bacterium]
MDLKLLRRDAHAMLDPTTRRNQNGWQVLDHLHCRALAAVRDHITGNGGGPNVHVDRSDATAELVASVSAAAAVVVYGESGVGKSALALRGVAATAQAKPYNVQALCINLRHLPKLTIQFEHMLGSPLSTLLGELSAPQRVLIVDSADAATEGLEEAFRYLVSAARDSTVKVVAVTSLDSQQVVQDIATEHFGTDDVAVYGVKALTDSEIDQIVERFPELSRLRSNPRSRKLLRRLVLADLFVRGRVRGVPLTDADAMREVWAGLVRRHEKGGRGSPFARDVALLRLAEFELYGGDRLKVISDIDPVALDGLCRDGLLRTSPYDASLIGPEFAHDEVRRYAVARLLLSGDTPASGLVRAGAPRWSLSAAQLACQAWLQRRETATNPFTGRLATLQESFDTLVKNGHGARWGDVPGEALLALAEP